MSGELRSDFRDLDVWKKRCEIQRLDYSTTQRIPKEYGVRSIKICIERTDLS